MNEGNDRLTRDEVVEHADEIADLIEHWPSPERAVALFNRVLDARAKNSQVNGAVAERP